MARRAAPKRLPALRFQVDGRHALAEIVELSGTTAFVRSAERPPEGRSVVFEWAGAARHSLVAVVRSVAEAAPDGRYGIALDVHEILSQEGQYAPGELARQRFGIKAPALARAAGASWSLRIGEGAADPTSAPQRTAPGLRLAGGSAASAAPPLDTGRPATTPELVAQLLESLGTRIGMYMNVPCAYWVAGAQYWGKAIRISDRWLQINTNVVVPGLGVRMRCDLTLDLDGGKRPVAVHGVLGRRQDGPPGGTYKAQLWVGVQTIEEGESPGLLAHWLERTFHERRGVDESE